MLCDRIACLVVNPITVNNFAADFYLHAGGSGLRFNEGSSLKTSNKVGWGSMFCIWSGLWSGQPGLNSLIN